MLHGNMRKKSQMIVIHAAGMRSEEKEECAKYRKGERQTSRGQYSECNKQVRQALRMGIIKDVTERLAQDVEKVAGEQRMGEVYQITRRWNECVERAERRTLQEMTIDGHY